MLRTLRTLLLCGLGAIAFHCPSLSLGQQAFPSFGEVDFFYSQDPQLFRNLWQTAQSQTVRIAVLGDSQEQSPVSHGFHYIPLLNYEMWQRFGNSPETPVEGCFFYGGGSSPPANWLVAGRCATPGPTATRLSSTQILPSVRATAFSTLSSSTNITGGNRGQLTMLQQDAIDVDPSAGIPTNVSYFNTSGVIKARIYAATNPSSGEVAYQARPDTAHVPAYSAAVTTAGTLTLGLQSPTFAIRSGATAALDFGGKPYMALEVFGTSDTQLTDIIGLRFFNETHPQGVVVDTFSLGGYSVSTFLRDHANAGAMFGAFGFQAAILHYGANLGTRFTAEQYKSDLSEVISRLRTWASDSAFPIILIADVYQDRLTPEQMAEYDQYVGAQLAIAQADSNVMVINARRLMEDIGWNASSGQSGQYLEDGVHYTGLGAQLLSAAVVSAMMGEVHVSGCPSDPGAVSLQSSMTLIVDLGGVAACTKHGQFRVAQSLTLNHPALKAELTNGFVPAEGDQFKLLSFSATSGSFGSMTLPTLQPGLSWNTSKLYTTGTISVAAIAPPPPPPPPPAPPTISVTSGASQAVTLPDAPAPIGFTLSGSGTLTVTVSSSNTTVLPDSGISVSSGCGARTLSCTATLTAANGQTGSSTVSLTVTDTLSQTAVATATLEVAAASGPGPQPPPPPPEPGTGSATDKGRGGGGSLDLLSLLGFAILLMHAVWAGSRQTRSVLAEKAQCRPTSAAEIMRREGIDLVRQESRQQSLDATRNQFRVRGLRWILAGQHES